MDPPSMEQNFDRQLIFTHPRIGQRKFMTFGSQILSQFRDLLENSSQLCIHTNYYFQYKGIKANQHEPLQMLSEEQNIRIAIVFSVFDFASARYHVIQTMDVIFNPQLYLYMCKSYQQEQNVKNVEYVRKVPNIDIQSLKPELTNQFLVGQSQIQKKVNLVISFSMSGFNPVPVSEKLSGDLLYVHCRTLQGQDIHITSSAAGFYVNQSKISSFNPAKSTVYKGVYGSLIDLLKAISDKFRQNLNNYLAQTPITNQMKYKFYSKGQIRKKRWLDQPQIEHAWGMRKPHSQSLHAELLNYRDWNQIFQTQIIQQGKQQMKEKLIKKTFLSKTYAEFQIAAYQGAIMIIDGKISPLNPTDQKKKHIYIHNKIFFSIANETVYDHSLDKGEQATPSSSSINTDIINIETVYDLNIPNLHVLHMILINYRGFKVIAQCIIPGILSIDQLNCCKYGSIDDCKTVETDPQFQKLMIQVCQKLQIEDNIQIIDSNNEKKRIAGSPDIKGILGSDKNMYFVDLLRLSPRDLNYEGNENEACVLRPQLLRNFRKAKGLNTKFNVNIGTDIKFQKSPKYQEQYKTVKSAANYLREVAIQNLVSTLKNYPSQYLTNNEGVARAFHFWGVNMRYLGEVCSHKTVQEQIQIKLVLERVIFIRCAKHLLRMAMRQTNIMYLGSAIVNLLNCLFGKKSHILLIQEGAINNDENQQKIVDKDAKKKKKKKTKQTMAQPYDTDINQILNIIQIQPSKYLSMKPQQIWDQINKIAKARYKYTLSKSQLDFAVFKYPFQKISALHDVCLSVGLVLQRKNYDILENNSFSSSQKFLPFCTKNIVAIEGRTKKMNIQPQKLSQRQRDIEQLISSYQVKQALKIDSILERQNIMISGGCNQTAIKLFSRMSRILYILGENTSAISQQQKNLCMLQSLHCQDHWLNIQSHINLGLYYIAANDLPKVVYYMTKGIFLMLITFGQTSPDLLVSFANLARIYQMNKEYKQAIRCYKAAMKFIQQIHGKYHVKMSFCYTSLATICYQMADIRTAIQHQTENVSILLKVLPQNDNKLHDAQKILKMYKQMYQKAQMQNSINNLARVVEVALRKPEQQKQGKKKQKKN